MAIKTKRKKSASGKYKFDEVRANRAVEWIETYCTHPKGKLTGQQLILPDWARNDVIRPAFGMVREDGRRQYSKIYVEIPRGNAKSTIGTAVALYLLMGDGEKTPEIYCAAGSKEQAAKVFEPAKIMVKQNEDLNESLKVYGHSIFDEETWGVMKVISADGKLQHGHNASGVIFDELHVQPNGGLYEALTTGLIKRDQPIIFIFTTAGVLGSFAEEIHNYAVKVRDGIIEDDSFLPVIYAADPDDDDFSEETWKKANPGWDYINHDEFEISAKMAKESAVFRNSFCRYNLNKWTGTETIWIDDDRFMRCNLGAIDEETLLGRECYVGLDLSSNRDTTALVYLFPPVGDEDKWVVLPKVFIPSDTLRIRSERETVQYLNWAQSDAIILTPGENQNQDLIFDFLFESAKRFNIKCVGFDAYHAGYIQGKMEREGIPCLPYRQNYQWMTAPMQGLETMINKGEFNHAGHPVLRWQNQCLQVATFNKGGADFMMPTKKKDDKHRIDAMVAWIVALGTQMILNAKYEEPEIESQGLYFI